MQLAFLSVMVLNKLFLNSCLVNLKTGLDGISIIKKATVTNMIPISRAGIANWYPIIL